MNKDAWGHFATRQERTPTTKSYDSFILERKNYTHNA